MSKLPQSQHPAVRAINFRIQIGKVIGHRRREIGLTQREVAERFGVSREMIAAVEQGRTDVNAGDLPRLAAILDVPIDYFFLTIPKRLIGEYGPIAEVTEANAQNANATDVRVQIPVPVAAHDSQIPVFTHDSQISASIAEIAEFMKRIDAKLEAVTETKDSSREAAESTGAA